MKLTKNHALILLVVILALLYFWYKRKNGGTGAPAQRPTAGV